MWANDLQKWQNGGEIITNPAPVGMIGHQSPRPAQSPRANPAPINRGPTNPPQSLQTPANRHQQTGPTNRANQPRPINPAKSTGANTRPNNRPIAGGQSPRKRANQSTRANPQQTPNNPVNGLLKWALTNLAKPKKPRFCPGSFWFYVNSQKSSNENCTISPDPSLGQNSPTLPIIVNSS